MRDPLPLQWMMSHIYPFAMVINEIRSNTLDGMEIWSGMCALLCIILNHSAIMAAWDIVVNRKPSFDTDEQGSTNTEPESNHEAV